jgi:hypothetical protein
MSESEVKLIREISRLTKEYSDRFSSTQPLTDGPSPTFDGDAAGKLQDQIKLAEDKLRRLRTTE